MMGSERFGDKMARKGREMKEKFDNSPSVQIMGKSGRKMQKEYQLQKKKYKKFKDEEWNREDIPESRNNKRNQHHVDSDEEFARELDEARADCWNCFKNPFG